LINFTETGTFRHNEKVVTQFDPSNAGTYYFTYIETTEFGCVDSCEFEIVVNSPPDVFAGNDKVITQGTATIIEDASVSGSGPYTYFWTPADLLVDSSVLHPATINLDTTTTFVLTVIDDNGCISSDEVIIDIEYLPPTILQAITGPDANCLGEAATVPMEIDNFNNVSIFHLKLGYNSSMLNCIGFSNVHPQLENKLEAWIDHVNCQINFQWESTTPLSFAGKQKIADLVFSLTLPGQANLDWYTGDEESYFINGQGQNIPAEFQAGEVNIYKPPVVILEDSVFLCVGDGYIVDGYAESFQPPVEYVWYYPDGSTHSQGPVFYGVTMADAGNYTLHATDRVGCTDQRTVTIVVSPIPVAAFHGTDTMIVEPGYLLEAGGGMASYNWNTGDTTENIIINAEGMYEVELTSFAGCIGIDSIYMLMPQEEIPDVVLFIPNAFTPDGDGLNDAFHVVPSKEENITSFNMQIYDRWGKFLWETYDINEGWPGTTNDYPCPVNAYVYKVIWGAANVPGKEGPIVETGIVMLVR
jgi:gliding motility-associated-like protein